MSLNHLRLVFMHMDEWKSVSIQLLRIICSKNQGTVYTAVSVNLTPQGKLMEFIQEIVDHYVNKKGGELDSFFDVKDYDGTTECDVIHKLDVNSPLIEKEYEAFSAALTNVKYEADPLARKQQAYVIRGNIEINGEEKEVKLVSMQNPITTLKHKFLFEDNTFKQIDTKVLSLRPAVDVLIFEGVVYFFTMAGEKLFNMERAYKAVCNSAVTRLEQSGIFFNGEMFGSVARSGHYPRMFVSFNEKRFEQLRSQPVRERFAEQFGIPLKNGLFDTSKAEASDKLVKLLCNKGMVDPFEDMPVEVSGAKKWK